MQYAVIIQWSGDAYRYHTVSTGRNLWAKSTAQRIVNACTYPPHQRAVLVPETDLSKWIGGRNV